MCVQWDIRVRLMTRSTIILEVKEISILFVVKNIVFISGQCKLRQNISFKEGTNWACTTSHNGIIRKYFQTQLPLQKTFSLRNSVYLVAFPLENMAVMYKNLNVLSGRIGILFLKMGGFAIPNLYVTYLK